MKNMPLTILVALVVLGGCTPYPRYRAHADVTPREQRPDDQQLKTNDFIRLGMILQRQLGKPYRGRSRWEPGVDCSKFVSDAFREFNKTSLPRTVAEQFKEGVNVARRRLRFGDLVFFRTERDRVSHVGVYLGFNEFIHASTSRGVIITNLSEDYWAKRFAGARRILQPPTP